MGAADGHVFGLDFIYLFCFFCFWMKCKNTELFFIMYCDLK